jgi:hypothetical protein
MLKNIAALVRRYCVLLSSFYDQSKSGTATAGRNELSQCIKVCILYDHHSDDCVKISLELSSVRHTNVRL